MAFSKFAGHRMIRILPSAFVLTFLSNVVTVAQAPSTPAFAVSHEQIPATAQATTPSGPQSVITRTCLGCHNHRTRSGSLSFEGFEVASADQHAETAEKMIRKLRA